MAKKTFSIKYHFIHTDGSSEVVDDVEYVLMAGSSVLFEEKWFVVTQCVNEIKRDGSVIVHYYCEKKKKDV